MAEDQSLEELIVSQLTALSLRADEETAEFVQGVVEESSFLPEVSLVQARTRLASSRTLGTGPEECHHGDARDG